MSSVPKNAGISMIEMMICLMILAIVALALADGLISAMSGTTVAEERSAALHSAQNQLQRLLGFGRHIAVNGTLLPNVSRLNVSDWNTGPADNGVVTDYLYADGSGAVTAPDPLHPNAIFDVTFGKIDSSGNGSKQEVTLPVLNPTDTAPLHQKTGELVVWYSELIGATATVGSPGNPCTGANFGRDLTGSVAKMPDGKPDGVNFDFAVINNDLDCDGACTITDIRTSAVDCFTNGQGRAPIGAIVRWRGGDGREQRVEVWSVADFTLQNPTGPQQ